MSEPAAPSKQDGTLDRLEQQSETHRAEFARTVDQLRNRVSPTALHADLNRQVSRAGRGVVADLERRVQQNPLQTVAVGAAIAYPAWQVLRNLPAPILLLGAGVALAGRGSPANEGQERSQERSRERAYVHVSSTAATTPRQASGASVDGVGSVATSGSGQARVLPTDASASADRTAPAAGHDAGSPSSYQPGVDATSEAARKAAATGRDGINGTIERYPLVVTGFGMLLGAALAACIPASRTENRLFGERSARLKDRARETADHTYDEAKAAGERIVANTMDEAREQGLTPQDAERAARKASDATRAVADQAVDAAVGRETPSPGKSDAGKSDAGQSASGRDDS